MICLPHCTVFVGITNRIALIIVDMSRSCQLEQNEGFYKEFFADTVSEESSDWDENEILDGPLR